MEVRKDKTAPIQVNMLMNVLLTLASILFPLIILPYVTRTLGPQGMGKVYFASSAIAFFSVFAELGIPVYGIKACAAVREDREQLTVTAHEILTINMISCVIVYAVLALCLAVIPRFAEDRLLLAVMSCSMILNAAGAEWLYKAFEKYTYITVRSLIFKTVALAAIFMMVHRESDYVIYGFLSISAAAASNIVNMTILHRHIDLKHTGRMDLKRHLPEMAALFSLAAATTIYANLDIAFLDFLKGDAQAGFYGVSVKIKLTLVNLITSVSAVLLPRVSLLFKRGEDKAYMDLLKKTMSAVNLISIPLVIFFAAFADECIMVLAGSEFGASVMPLRIIIPSVFIIGMSNIVGMQMLVPMGKESSVAKAAWTGAAADLMLNALLIPRFGPSGAAASTLSAEIIVMAVLMKAAGPGAENMISKRTIAGSLMASTVSVPAAVWLKLTGLGALAMVASAALCYFITYCFIIFILLRKNVLLR